MDRSEEGQTELPEPSEYEGEPVLSADRDLELLSRPDLRSVRLQLEYLKTELAFVDRGVRHTIVVFGGARLVDERRASERVRAAERQIAAREPEAERALTLAQRDLSMSRYYEEARELGRLVGQCGGGPRDCRLIVLTGGGPGAMEAANRGAHEVGAVSAGLNVELPHEQRPNRFITEGLGFRFRYFALRKLHFMLRARALVVFPGGYGTFDELFEMLCLVQTGKSEPLPIVLVGSEFWQRVVDWDFLSEQGVIGEADRALFRIVDSASDAWRLIQDWHAARGISLIDGKAP